MKLVIFSAAVVMAAGLAFLATEDAQSGLISDLRSEKSRAADQVNNAVDELVMRYSGERE